MDKYLTNNTLYVKLLAMEVVYVHFREVTNDDEENCLECNHSAKTLVFCQ